MKTKIGIIDYGMGNLHSVVNALAYLQIESFVSADFEQLSTADGLILPGVGAFPDAMDRLETTGLVDFIRQYVQEKTMLGICLGMQLLFDKSYEFEEREGLKLIAGEVVKIDHKGFKVPHMGWNSLQVRNECALLDGILDISNDPQVYFVHSYKAVVKDAQDLVAVTDYGGEITAIVRKGNVFGCQFHPEKSSEIGLKILKNYGRIVHDSASGN